MAEKLLRMFVGLFIGIWVARYLGPDKFGMLSYAQSLVFIFLGISTLGLDRIVVKELIERPQEEAALIGTSFWLKFIGAVVLLPILGLAVFLTGDSLYVASIVFVIASSAIFQSFNVIDFLFQAKVKSKYVALANSFVLAISSILKIALIISNADLIAFSAMVVLDAFILSLGLVYFYRKNGGTISLWRFDSSIARRLLFNSWPLIISTFVLAIQSRVDQLMLEGMIGVSEVGYYSAALKIVEAFGFVPMVLATSLLPAVVSARNETADIYRFRLLNYYRLSFLLFLVVFFPLFWLSEEIVSLLFGKQYQAAGVILEVMVFRLFFANFGVARGVFINAENLFKYSLLTLSCGTFINVLVNYLLIPSYASVGAVVATIISFFVTIFLIDAFYARTAWNLRLMLKAVLTAYKVQVVR